MRDTHKLCDAALVAAEVGQLFTHDRVQHSLHGGEDQSGRALTGGNHGRQGNEIANFLTVGVTSEASLCRLGPSFPVALRHRVPQL